MNQDLSLFGFEIPKSKEPEIEKCKFEDSTGEIDVQGIKVKWKFRANYIGMCHIEFDSNKVPSAISETGYRSHFVSAAEMNSYKTLQVGIDWIAGCLIREHEKTNKPKKSKKAVYRCIKCSAILEKGNGYCPECHKEELKAEQVKMTIDYGYGFATGSDYYNQEPVEDFVVRFQNYGCLGSVGACAGTPEEIVKKYTDDMLKEGYKPENIIVETSPRTPEKLIEMKKMISDRKTYFDKQESDNFKKNGEKEIAEYSEKLKKLLKIKYGCEVTIKVLKK